MNNDLLLFLLMPICFFFVLFGEVVYLLYKNQKLSTQKSLLEDRLLQHNIPMTTTDDVFIPSSDSLDVLENEFGITDAEDGWLPKNAEGKYIGTEVIDAYYDVQRILKTGGDLKLAALLNVLAQAVAANKRTEDLQLESYLGEIVADNEGGFRVIKKDDLQSES